MRSGASTNQPSRLEIEQALQSAIFGTYAVEGDLIEDGASERSIVFHIAARLERCVELWGAPWRVDTDYNRQHDKPTVAKFMNSFEGRRVRVLPDIVVHDPSEFSPEANLLAVEVKKSTNRTGRKVDYWRLNNFRFSLHYQHAVFLELSKSGPAWRWFEEWTQENELPYEIPDWNTRDFLT